MPTESQGKLPLRTIDRGRSSAESRRTQSFTGSVFSPSLCFEGSNHFCRCILGIRPPWARLAVFAGIALLPVSVARAGDAPDWPRFRGPHGNGIGAEQLTLLPEPRQLWRGNVGKGNASVLVAGDRLFTVGNKERGGPMLSCLEADTGRVVWERPVETGCVDSSPLLLDGRLYVLCHLRTPQLRCLDARDGAEVWSCDLPRVTGGERAYGHAGSPLPWQDLIVVNAGLGAAVDRRTGRVVWQHDGLPGLAMPVAFRHGGRDGVLIFGGKELVARDLRTGEMWWSLPWETKIAVNACDPVPHDGRVFLSTDYGKHAALYDVRGAEPRELWREKGSAYSSGVLWQGHLYITTGYDFACLDFQTGERRWTVNDAGGGAVILAGDQLILINSQGTLWVAPASPEAFRPLVRTKTIPGTTRMPPALSQGRL
jgi:outer membrane protein assembly factor BamB